MQYHTTKPSHKWSGENVKLRLSQVATQIAAHLIIEDATMV